MNILRNILTKMWMFFFSYVSIWENLCEKNCFNKYRHTLKYEGYKYLKLVILASDIQKQFVAGGIC